MSSSFSNAHVMAGTTKRPWGAHRPNGWASLPLWLARNTPLGRGVMRRVLYRWFSALHAGPVDVRLWGNDVRLYPAPNFVERKVLMRPDRTDVREYAVLNATMAYSGACFVDIGGNAGLYSLSAALHALEPARILMIEPDADLIARFQFNIEQARAAGSVRERVVIETYPIAISDCEGSGVLSQGGDEASRALVSRSAGGKEVVLTTLAKLVADAGLDHIDIMKIDVEGHEDKVLCPFLSTAPQMLWPGVIILEHVNSESWQTDCLKEAVHRGYRIDFTTNLNTILRRR